MTRPECGYDWDELLSDGFYQVALWFKFSVKITNCNLSLI